MEVLVFVTQGLLGFFFCSAFLFFFFFFLQINKVNIHQKLISTRELYENQQNRHKLRKNRNPAQAGSPTVGSQKTKQNHPHKKAPSKHNKKNCKAQKTILKQGRSKTQPKLDPKTHSCLQSHLFPIKKNEVIKESSKLGENRNPRSD